MIQSLETELAIFNEHRLGWCQSHTGKYAVIQDSTILEPFFDDWETGLKAGYKHFDITRPFLVKEILEKDRVIFIGGV